MILVVIASMVLSAAPGVEPPPPPTTEPEPAQATASTPFKPAEWLIRPTAEPRPALRYRVVPEHPVPVPGNAALFYYRAIQMAAEIRANIDRPPTNALPSGGPSVDQRISQWTVGPLSSIPLDEARSTLESFDRVFREIELGINVHDCEWAQHNRTEGVALLIPEIQAIRNLSRLVQLRSQVAIRDGRIDDAFHGVQTLYAMGRHTAKGPTLIGGLVGIALSQVATATLELLIQAPVAPNLYWALANRPRPMIDLTPSLEWERFVLERELPGLDKADQAVWNLDQCRQFAIDLEKILGWMDGVKLLAELGTVSRNAPNPGARTLMAILAARGEAENRQSLLADGLPADRVAAMPSFQVMVIRTYHNYVLYRDDEYKALGIPAWQAIGRPWAKIDSDAKTKDPLFAIFYGLLPATNAALVAQTRLERRLDALQTVEALRLYLHGHDGHWPARLEELTQTPVPIDPSTGRAFDFRVEGDEATLSAPVPPGYPNHPTSSVQLLLKRAL